MAAARGQAGYMGHILASPLGPTGTAVLSQRIRTAEMEGELRTTEMVALGALAVRQVARLAETAETGSSQVEAVVEEEMETLRLAATAETVPMA